MAEKMKIELKQRNELEGMSYFLDEVILPSLQDNRMDKYKGFLTAMAEHDDTLYQVIARRLGKLLCNCIGWQRGFTKTLHFIVLFRN